MPGMVPFGANYAVRSTEQKRYQYDPRLGASPSGSYMVDETTLMRAIFRARGTGIWVPSAKVQHINGADRMTMKYLSNYYRNAGCTEAFLTAPQDGRMLLQRPIWLWRHSLESGLSFYLSRAFSPSTVWLERFSVYATAVGKFYEMAVLGRGKPQSKNHTALAAKLSHKTTDIDSNLQL